MTYTLPPEGHSRFESVLRLCRNGAVVTHEDIRTVKGKRVVERYCYVDSKTVRDTAARLLEGKPYYVASIRYPLEKEVMAFIHVNAEKILAMEPFYPANGDFGWDGVE